LFAHAEEKRVKAEESAERRQRELRQKETKIKSLEKILAEQRTSLRSARYELGKAKKEFDEQMKELIRVQAALEGEKVRASRESVKYLNFQERESALTRAIRTLRVELEAAERQQQMLEDEMTELRRRKR
jgi:hypothetical protein